MLHCTFFLECIYLTKSRKLSIFPHKPRYNFVAESQLKRFWFCSRILSTFTPTYFMYPAGFFTALAWNCDVIFANPRSSRCHVVKSIPLSNDYLLCTPLNEQCTFSGFKFLHCFDVWPVLRMNWGKTLLCLSLGECSEMWSLFVEENWPLGKGPRTIAALEVVE